MDIDYFFFYGQLDQRKEIEADLLCGLAQGRRTMFYHRSYGAGIPEFENSPVGLALNVSLRYEAAAWVARRNLEVSDGTGGYRDRRAVTSQPAIEISGSGGQVDVQVPYVPAFDVGSVGRVSVRVSG